MLFYLRARGIDVKSAQRLLLKAFSEEVIEKIKDDKLRARVSALLEEKLAV
jgi:Fe-S cluster assembly scaffold protein SufB